MIDLRLAFSGGGVAARNRLTATFSLHVQSYLGFVSTWAAILMVDLRSF
jgi:hypothetical protein